MPTLQEVVKAHLARTGRSVRSLADETRISYPTLLNVVNKGNVPRKPEHRNRLRTALSYDEKEWGSILVASTHQTARIPSDGPLNLQQLITREMYARELTEQSLASCADLPYPTVMGVTRKGAIPRADSLKKLAVTLEIDIDDLEAAVERSKAQRKGIQPEARASTAARSVPPLGDLVMELINTRGQSIAGFAHDVGIGYLSLARFLESGVVPDDPEIIEALRRALGLEDKTFAAALEKALANPMPVEVVHYDQMVGPNGSPLQNALASYMREKKLTLKGLARKAGLSQVTVSRLVKQGQPPTRAITHQKLQHLLGLDPSAYQNLVSQPTQALTSSITRTSEGRGTALTSFDDTDTEDYEPQEPGSSTRAMMDEETLEALIGKLSPKQKRALKGYLKSML